MSVMSYLFQGGLHYCEVSLNGLRFCGSQCHSKEEAAESAASIALIQMVGKTDHNHMYMYTTVKLEYFKYVKKIKARLCC